MIITIFAYFNKERSRLSFKIKRAAHFKSDPAALYSLSQREEDFSEATAKREAETGALHALYFTNKVDIENVSLVWGKIESKPTLEQIKEAQTPDPEPVWIDAMPHLAKLPGSVRDFVEKVKYTHEDASETEQGAAAEWIDDVVRKRVAVGRVKSERGREAARENGRKGGRPKNT